MRTTADTTELRRLHFHDCATRYLTRFKLDQEAFTTFRAALYFGSPSLEVRSKACNTKKLRAISNHELISQGSRFHETFGLEHVNTTSTTFSSSAKQLADWLTG